MGKSFCTVRWVLYRRFATYKTEHNHHLGSFERDPTAQAVPLTFAPELLEMGCGEKYVGWFSYHSAGGRTTLPYPRCAQRAVGSVLFILFGRGH